MSTAAAPRIGSLCSGYGGLDLAVEAVFGGRTVWHCEIEDAPSKILTAHWDVPNHRDLKTVDWSTVEQVDIMTAGYPCQPFSHAGRRGGTDDPRHLWPFVAEAVRRVRPRYVVLENVAGHRTLGFDAVLGELAEAGYDAQWVCLRASDIGAPHGRERLFILATDTDSARREGNRALASVKELFDAHGDHRAVADSKRRGRYGRPSQPFGGSEGRIAATGCGPDLASDSQGDRRDEGWTEPARLERGSDAAERRHSDGIDWGIYEPAIRRWERLTRVAPHPTEPGPRGARRLSAAFDEWMQGLPAGWVTDVPISRNEQLKALGKRCRPAAGRRGVMPAAAYRKRGCGMTESEIYTTLRKLLDDAIHHGAVSEADRGRCEAALGEVARGSADSRGVRVDVPQTENEQQQRSGRCTEWTCPQHGEANYQEAMAALAAAVETDPRAIATFKRMFPSAETFDLPSAPSVQTGEQP